MSTVMSCSFTHPAAAMRVTTEKRCKVAEEDVVVTAGYCVSPIFLVVMRRFAVARRYSLFSARTKQVDRRGGKGRKQQEGETKTSLFYEKDCAFIIQE